MAPRREVGVRAERTWVRRLLRVQERLRGLLPTHGRRRDARSVRERGARPRHWLHDRSHHRPVAQLHRTACARPFLSGGCLQRAALAIPEAGQAVYGARQRPASAAVRCRLGDQAGLRRDAGTCRPGHRSYPGPARQDRTHAEHAGHLHQRQRRGMALAQCAALPPEMDAVGRRHPRTDHSAMAR